MCRDRGLQMIARVPATDELAGLPADTIVALPSTSQSRSSPTLALTLTTSVFALLCVTAVALAKRPNQGKDESAAFVEEGRSALKKGELDDAAKSLDQALALNP